MGDVQKEETSCGSSIVIVGHPDSHCMGNDQVAAWVEENRVNSLCRTAKFKGFHVDQNYSVNNWQLDEIGSVPYSNFRIRIYEKRNQQIYYYSPVVLLQTGSVVGHFNWVTQEAQVCFDVLLWNAETEETVIEFLKATGRKVSKYQVQMIPFQKLMLYGAARLPYRLASWTPYNMNQTVVFTMTCPSKESADALAKQMKRDPQQFAHLRVKFALDEQVRNNVYVFSINTGPAAQDDAVLASKHLLRKIDCKLQGTLDHVDYLQQRLDSLNKDQRLAGKFNQA